MTRKHYEMIAKAITTARKQADIARSLFGELTAEQMTNEIIFQIGTALKKDNDRFDICKFATACEATDI